MNIQFNLLPAVKLEYSKTQRNKRLTVLIAGAFTAVSIIVVIALFLVVQVFQKSYSTALSKDIKDQTQKLQGVTDINKILTIQNQLASLEVLHAKKPATPRLLEYIQKVTPADVSISSMDTDFTQQTITISGTAGSITAVNKFVDTLKFTSYSPGKIRGEWKIETQYKINETVFHRGVYYMCTSEHSSSDATEPGVGSDASGVWKSVPSAFSAVVLNNFSPAISSTGYSVSFKFDPVIFDGNSDVSLIVPENKITTRSEIERPALFQSQTQGGQ